MQAKEIIANNQVELPADLYGYFRQLRQRAINTAYIDLEIPDFIHLDWLNDEIDHDAEEKAAAVAVSALKTTKPNIVIGIGKSGLSYGRTLACILDTWFSQVDKIDHDNGNNYNKRFREYDLITAHSYSKNKDMQFLVPFLPPESRVLIADDVIAHGNIGLAVYQSLKRQENVQVVAFSSYMDKAFLHGLENIEEEIKVPVFSVIRIGSIKPDKSGIELLPEEKSLTLKQF